MKNNYAFIDSQNLNLGILSQGWKLDFARFRVYLRDKYKVTKAFLFIGFIPGNQNLYSKLQDFGYHMVYKPTLETRDKKIKGNVDAELVLHAMIEFQNYKQAVIVSGDGDFYCLVDHLNNKGKLLKLLVPNPKFSKLLRPFAANKIARVSDLKLKLEVKKREAIHKDQPL